MQYREILDSINRRTYGADKVVDWYTAKLKPTKIVSPGVVIGSGGLAVLEGANGKAVITGTDEGTSVIFKGQAQ